jgi:hypothetical protein
MSDATTATIAATINGGEFSPEGLRFEMDVNSFPMVSANIAETNGQESVKVPISPEVLARIGELQKSRLAGRITPDFSVEAEDGIGNNINYTGFISAPILELTQVNTAEKLASVGVAALLDSLDLSIYKAGYVTEREEVSSNPGQNQFDPIPSSRDGNITRTLEQVTNILVGNFDRTMKGETRALTKKLFAITHEINTSGPLAVWNEMLLASDVKYESWEKAFRKCPPMARQLTERVRTILGDRTPGFWNKVRAFMSAFQMHYIPSFDGVGRFERADKKVAEANDNIELSVSGFSVADGSPRLLHPGGVVMSGSATAAHRPEGAISLPSVVAYWPNPLLRGFIQHEVPPFWLLRNDGIPVMGSEVETKAVPSGGSAPANLSLPALKVRTENAVKYRKEVDDLSEGIMTELCKIMFEDMRLAQSTVGMTLPLNFRMSDYIGKRVNVKINGQDPSLDSSFEAFVQGITHSVDLRAGKQLSSFTQMRLSHAKFFE